MEDEKEEGQQEGQEEKKEPEEPDVPQDDYYPPENLMIEKTTEIIKQGLGKIGKTPDGGAYAFVELNCDNKNLNNLYNIMDNYPYLRKISFINNQLSDIQTLAWINYLTHLNLSKNEITSIGTFNIKDSLQFLQELNLSNNRITRLDPILLPRLQKLNLNYNLIESAELFEGHPNLQLLEIRKNRLKNLKGQQWFIYLLITSIKNLPCLTELYVAENEIETISDLYNLPSLKKFHIRKNKLVEFKDVPNLPLLYHLNIRENQIAKLDEFRNLLKFQAMRSLTTHQNPLSEEIGDAMKKEILMILQELNRINKEEVRIKKQLFDLNYQISTEEKQDAINELKERIAEAERKRKEEEEERIRIQQEEAERKAQQQDPQEVEGD